MQTIVQNHFYKTFKNILETKFASVLNDFEWKHDKRGNYWVVTHASEYNYLMGEIQELCYDLQWDGKLL